MYQLVEMTYEEKVELYKKCPKDALIQMLLENQRLLEMSLSRNSVLNYGYEYEYQTNLTVGDTCSCNPKNGGNGICHCTMANTPLQK